MRYAVLPSLPQAVKREKKKNKKILSSRSGERVVERSNDRVSQISDFAYPALFLLFFALS